MILAVGNSLRSVPAHAVRTLLSHGMYGHYWIPAIRHHSWSLISTGQSVTTIDQGFFGIVTKFVFLSSCDQQNIVWDHLQVMLLVVDLTWRIHRIYQKNTLSTANILWGWLPHTSLPYTNTGCISISYICMSTLGGKAPNDLRRCFRPKMFFLAWLHRYS